MLHADRSTAPVDLRTTVFYTTEQVHDLWLSVRPRARACVAQNYGQGLGFVLAGTVIDKRSLKAAMFKLIGAVSTVIAYLLTLSEDAE